MHGLNEQLLEEVRRRTSIVEEYFRNYYEYLSRRKFAKASEALWGILNNLASILSVLYGGEPISKHVELRELVTLLAKKLGNQEILRWYRACEKLHANYFHNFMDEDEFEEHRIEAEKLIDELQKTGVRGVEEARHRTLKKPRLPYEDSRIPRGSAYDSELRSLQ